jgi:hypothetical protein
MSTPPSPSLTTTYLGHRIDIEPCEWGYLARVIEEKSDRQLVTVNASAMQALENAFDLIDESQGPRSD